MTEQEQIEALKAQVNCLYEVLDKSRLLGKAKTAPEMRRIEQEIRELISRTSKQCLAEVKAKAIYEAIQSCSSSSKYGDICEAKCLQFYADQLRGQVK